MQIFHIRQVLDDGSERTAGRGVTFPDGTTVLQLDFWQTHMTFATEERALTWLASEYVTYKVVTKPPFPGEEHSMSNRTAQYTEITYQGGCETCQGLAVMWTDNVQVLAHRHAVQTGHRGIWYTRTTKATYHVTDAMTPEEMEAEA